VNATSVDAAAPTGSRTRTLLDRVLALLPVIGIAHAVITFYCVEVWTRKTPWLFTDELEWTQLSRAIEETGHAARRGEPLYFKSLYAFMIAPFWAFDSTATAYAAIKYANAVVMPLAAVPTYLLARMMLPKRTAVVVALLAICIPGMAYVGTIVPEVLAYPAYALCSWLIVRALVSWRPLDVALAVAACVFAILVRPQLATAPASFAIAAAGLWITGPRGRAMRAHWRFGDTLGAIVLLAGALLLFNRIVLQHVEIWQISTEYWKGRMVDLGLQAALAFTVGMGILPVVGGLVALRLKERLDDPVYRAFVAYLAATILCVSLYTAVKAAYLSTVFSTLTEERNMIYLAPTLLIGTALVLHSKRIDWRIVAAASAFVAFIIFEKPLQLAYPYIEAPGFGILTIFNREWSWTVEDLHLLLVGALAVSLAVLAFRRYTAVLAVAALLGAGWMLSSEITTTHGFDGLANRLRAHLPAQLDWVDRRVDGRVVTYLGQRIQDPNGLLLTEFWNRSVRHVYSLDGTAPGPGPAGTPDVVAPDGTLSRIPPDTSYVLADNGVVLQAPIVASEGQLRLYRKVGPWKLLDGAQQLYSDGWIAGWATYTYFVPGRRGTLVVTLSRTGYNGDAPAGHARLAVGTVRINRKTGSPAVGTVYDRRTALVENGKSTEIRVPVARTPVRVVITISPTFRASEADPRALGAQAEFRFVPAKRQG
jgi:hypothetical protein